MRTLLRSLPYGAFLLSILLAAACETADEAEQVGTDVEEATGVDGDDDLTDEGLIGEDIDDEGVIDEGLIDEGATGEVTHELVVVNPMPHAMIVSLDENGEVSELGQVPANGRQTFEVPAPPGTAVTLIARDEAKTHTPTGEVTLTQDRYATWTIE